MKNSRTKTRARGKLKIGDDWNAITIIALSQSNPLRAIAELVENSIDAKARTVTPRYATTTPFQGPPKPGAMKTSSGGFSNSLGPSSA